MKLQIHFIRFNSDYKLIKLIKKKLIKLETFYNRIIDGEVFLRIGNDESKINKIIEIKLNIPGDQLFAKERARTFEIGADEVTEGAYEFSSSEIGRKVLLVGIQMKLQQLSIAVA